MSTVLVDHAPEVIISTSVNNAVVNINSTNVVSTTNTSNVVQYVDQEYTPVSVGIQGPQGIPGASDNYIYLVATETIGGSRAVSASASGAVYSSTNSNSVLGISTGAVLAGAVIQIQISGIFTEPSWNWTLNQPIFVSNSGILTQQVPETGALLIIGYPVLSTQIFIDKQAPILLG